MSLNLFLPAMPDMAADFNVSQATISLTLSGYLVVTGGLQLLIGPLSDALGRRPIVLGSLTVYAIASLGAAYATTIELFLLARFIQGTAIAGNVLSQAIIRDTSVDQRQAATRIAVVAMVMAVGPMIAPVVGGALSNLFGWRSISISWLHQQAHCFSGAGLIVLKPTSTNRRTSVVNGRPTRPCLVQKHSGPTPVTSP